MNSRKRRRPGGLLEKPVKLMGGSIAPALRLAAGVIPMLAISAALLSADWCELVCDYYPCDFDILDAEDCDCAATWIDQCGCLDNGAYCAEDYYCCGGLCDSVNAECVECEIDEHCAENEVCVAGICEADEDQPTSGEDDGGGNNSSDDPVNTVTGAFMSSETDLILPGRYPIVIRRVYNSKNPHDSMFGAYWRPGYNPYLYMGEAGSGLIKAADGDGRVMIYSNGPAPECVSAGDCPDGGHCDDNFQCAAAAKYSDAIRSPSKPGGNRKRGYVYEAAGQARSGYSQDPLVYRAYPEYNPGIVNYTRDGIGSIHNPFSQVIRYDPDLDAYTLTCGNGEKRFYERNPLNPSDGLYHLTLITDPNGAWLSFGYQDEAGGNGYGKIAAMQNSSGSSVSIEYNDQGRIASVNAGDGRSVYYEYNGMGDLVTFIDAGGTRTDYEYASHRITRIGRPDDRVLENVYTEIEPGDFRVTEQKTNAGTIPAPAVYNRLSYDLDLRATTITDALGHATVYRYDTWARIIEIEYADGTNQQFHYDTAGNLVEQIDRRGAVTAREYDDKGNVTAEIRAAGTAEQSATLYTYDPLCNKVASITDCLGGKTVNEYDEAGNLMSRKRRRRNDELYEETRYVLNGYGEPIQEIAAYGTADQAAGGYTYNNMGKIETRTNPENDTVSYQYDPRGNLTSITNGEGETIHYAYDSMNRKTSATNALEETTAWEYDANGNMIKRTDPLGRETLYAYDYANRLVAVTLPLPSRETIRYEYDAAGNKTKTIDALGRETFYEYDTLNRLVRVSGAACCGNTGAWIEYDHDPNGNRTRVTTPAGATACDYDAMNRLVRITDPELGVRLYEYDCLGQKAKETDGNGNYTSYEYDDFKRTVRIEYRDALDNVLSHRSFGYDRRDNIVTRIDGRGHAAALRYDSADRLTGSADPYGRETISRYDRAGRLIERIDANGHRDFLLGYDGAGRVTAIEDALQKTVEYEYDAAGNKIIQRDQEGNETIYEYDELNRLKKTTDALGHETINDYDALHLIRKTDAAGNVTRYAYNDRNKITIEIDPLWNMTRYEYDESGNRTKIIDPKGREIGFAYDGLDRPIRKTDQLGHTTTFGYDSAGNLTLKTDPNGNTVALAYDGLNRLVSRSDTEATYAYDGNGNLLEMADPSGTTAYAYDDDDRLTSVASPRGTINYTYDHAGNRASMTYPDGRTLAYYYREDDRLERIEDSAGGTISYGYDDGNNLVNMEYPNGTGKQMDYDELRRMTSLADKKDDDTVIRAYEFAYDELGNKTRALESNASGPALERNFEYDRLSRLISEETGGEKTRYAYDSLGNRLSKSAGDRITGYEYNALNQLIRMGDAAPDLRKTIEVKGGAVGAGAVVINDLEAVLADGQYVGEASLTGGWNRIYVTATGDAGKQAHKITDVFLAGNSVTFAYDDNGNMTSMADADGTTYYSYDAGDRLTGIAYPDDRPATTYSYDGLDKRVRQQAGAEVTGYLWDGDKIILELDAAAQPVATLIHGPGLDADVGSVVKAERNGQNQFFHYDWRGCVTALSDPGGRTIQTYAYDAFGNLTRETGDAINPYRFSSKQFDPASGLSCFGRRYYYALLGRFTAQDPKEYIEGLNTYTFARNNPINRIDPAGFSSEDDSWCDDGYLNCVDAAKASLDICKKGCDALNQSCVNGCVWYCDYLPDGPSKNACREGCEWLCQTADYLSCKSLCRTAYGDELAVCAAIWAGCRLIY